MQRIEGVVSARWRVVSQHTDRQVWLTSNCETHAKPKGACMESLFFLPSTEAPWLAIFLGIFKMNAAERRNGVYDDA